MMIHQQLPSPLLLPHIKGTSQQIFAPLSAALIHPILRKRFGDYSEDNSRSSFFWFRR